MRVAHDLGPNDLVLSNFSIRTAGLEARAKAAAGAGCAGIGLFLGDWARMRESGTTALHVKAVLDDHGLVLAELEALRGWADPAGTPEAAAFERGLTLAFELADGVGARYLQTIGPYPGTVDDAAAGFASLCDRAADHGLLVGLEFLPFTNIATAADAWAIARLSGRPNAGLCVDSWHHERGARDLSLITAVPADRIFAIQLDDGTITPQDPDYYTDTLTNRCVPGEGEFDLVGLIRALDSMGVQAPISMEVISSELQQLPHTEAARRIADGMRAVIARARSGTGPISPS